MKNTRRQLLALLFLLVSTALAAQTVYITNTGKKYHKGMLVNQRPL